MANRGALAAGVHIAKGRLCHDAAALIGGQPDTGVRRPVWIVAGMRGTGGGPGGRAFAGLPAISGLLPADGEALLRNTTGAAQAGPMEDPPKRATVDRWACRGRGAPGLQSRCAAFLPQKMSLRIGRAVDQPASR
ncbi:hypothetical protein LNKW23_23790 [Paralimibaculum aggregatum]|uniref:Uncharacterized protein n=2 Tax=Paralimibaculum aggregatum TaxID=3036245 RepID=A0ABQ6LQR6_9RHOB|nr:hypothetical protein LNKW23_23790 [Limibaculum sp. NKW23]